MILDLGLAVRVVTAVRSHTAQTHGCPEWEGHGVQAALIGTEGAPGIVLAAALIAAEDPGLRLPSPAAFRQHWPKHSTVTPPPPSHNVRCADHPQHDMPCPHPAHDGDMTLEQIAEAKRICLAAAEAARTPNPTRPTLAQEA